MPGNFIPLGGPLPGFHVGTDSNGFGTMNVDPVSMNPVPFFPMSQVDNSGTISKDRYGFDSAWSDWYKNQVSGFKPATTDLNLRHQDAAREQQQNFIQQLHRMAQGDPNSLAQQQLRQSTQMAQGQLGGAIAARGNFGGAGAAMRQARAGQQAIGAAGVDASGLLMQQERAAAQQALAQALAAQRQQDIGQAGLMSDTALKNTALNDALYQYYFNQGTGSSINRGQMSQDAARAELGFDLEKGQLDRQFRNQLLAGGAGLAGTGVSIYNKLNKNPIDEAFDNG